MSVCFTVYFSHYIIPYDIHSVCLDALSQKCSWNLICIIHLLQDLYFGKLKYKQSEWSCYTCKTCAIWKCIEQKLCLKANMLHIILGKSGIYTTKPQLFCLMKNGTGYILFAREDFMRRLLCASKLVGKIKEKCSTGDHQSLYIYFPWWDAEPYCFSRSGVKMLGHLFVE